MALAIFSQSFGAAVFLSLSELIFSNSFRTLLGENAPSVDAESVIKAGATGFRRFVSKTELAGVLVSYSQSIDRVFYLAAAMGAGCFVFALGTGWKNLKQKPAPSKA
jgi:hypothetical protein